MLRSAVIFILLYILAGTAVAQVVTPPDTIVAAPYKFYRDSAYLARKKQYNDSLFSHALVLISMKSEGNPVIDSLLQANKHTGLNVFNIAETFPKKGTGNTLRQGTYLPKGALWGLALIAAFLVLFSLLRNSFSRPLLTIVQAFYSNRILGNLNKEDNLFTSWPFLLLFILFGFVIGMFYYLVTQFYQLAGGFRYFLTISVLIVVLYISKILVLKVIGHFFNVKKAVNEYVTILFLSYFNAGLLFLPLVVLFALSPLKFGVYFIITSYIILTLIIGLQFIRAGINILSNYRFPKLYLLLYFCALEICPILILLKAIHN